MSYDINIVSLLLLISIGSFLIPFCFGRFIALKGIQLLIIICSFFSVCLTTILLCISINFNNIFFLKLINWIKIELISINFGILIDPLAIVMLFVVSIISFCANLYSMEYLNSDPYIIRYFSYLALFTFFMILLVTSENLIQLFIGWEGVGICSYILINFWYCRVQANKASILAVVANKLGDIALLIGAIIIYFIFKSNSFSTLYHIFSLIKDYFYFVKFDVIYTTNLINFIDFDFFFIVINNTVLLEIAMILFVIACIGKSAQFGFHFWLPEAMEGPTPVSSLIHAATMVTAGIFLILRMSNLLVLTQCVNIYILIVGAVTLFFSATIGVTQVDIKKIVAYSTCSQLGYMFLSCGFHGFSNAFFHLFIHAFFKALLFLSSGYIIHLLCNEQDLRKMGGILKIAPLSYNFVLIGSVALIGFPFMSGWYSKETLIEFLLTKNFENSNIYLSMITNFSIVLAFTTVIITLIYSIKSILNVFFFTFNGFKYYVKNLHYNNMFINFPLIILGILSIYSGYLFNDLFVGINSNYLGLTLNITTNFTNIINEYYPYYRTFIIMLLTYFSFVYLIIAKYCSNFFFILIKNNTFFYNLHFAITKKYIYLNRFFLFNNIKKILNISYNTMYALIDKGILEILGPYGITYNLYKWTVKISKLQTGYIYHYIGYIFIILLLLLFVIVFVFY